MTISYQAFARVTVVLTVAVTDTESKLEKVDDVRQIAAMLAQDAVTEALKREATRQGHGGVPGVAEHVEVTLWPEAMVVELSLNWTKGK